MPYHDETLFGETNLQRDTPLFRNLLDKLPIGAYSCDRQGFITYYNQAAELIWGRTPQLNNPQDKYCGAHKLLNTDGTIIPHSKSYIAKTLKHRVEHSGYEMIIEQPDGKQLNVIGYANPMFDNDGNISGVVSILVDYTYQKMAEEEKHKKEKQLLYSKKLESLGILASGVAHNFNNILTAIIGNTNLAIMATKKGSNLYYKLKQIENSTESAAELSKKMLAYSGQGKFIVELIRIDDLIRKLISKNNEVIFEQALIRLDLKPASVIGDVNEISQMIYNLVTNAIESLNDKQGNIFINTGTRFATREDLESPHFPKELPTGYYSFISIKDTGSGMDEEILSKIFDPFFSTKFTGRGLGLAAAQGIVSGHSGIIQVSSKPGEGTTFEVLLPCENGIN